MLTFGRLCHDNEIQCTEEVLIACTQCHQSRGCALWEVLPKWSPMQVVFTKMVQAFYQNGHQTRTSFECTKVVTHFVKMVEVDRPIYENGHHFTKMVAKLTPTIFVNSSGHHDHFRSVSREGIPPKCVIFDVLFINIGFEGGIHAHHIQSLLPLSKCCQRPIKRRGG